MFKGNHMNALYTYWLNEPHWHAQKLCELVATSLSDADAYFKTIHGYDPAKKPTIGVTVTDGK
jgi:hypothetical protein